MSGRWSVAAISGGKMSVSTTCSRSKRKTQSEAQRRASELKRGRRERSDEWGRKYAACSGTRRIKGASNERVRASLPTWSQNLSNDAWAQKEQRYVSNCSDQIAWLDLKIPLFFFINAINFDQLQGSSERHSKRQIESPHSYRLLTWCDAE